MAIYLDNNSTTPLAPEVIETMTDVLKKHFGNPASSSHSFGWFAEELVSIAREQVASLIHAQPEEIVFTSGATESNNLVLKGLLPCRRVLSSPSEHKSILDPLTHIAKRGVEIDYLPLDTLGHIATRDFEICLERKPSLVSLMLANNEVGTIHDCAHLFALAKSSGALTHCDATQALGKIEIDVSALGADFVSLSAHKVYGPKGVGALYVNPLSASFLTNPLLHGGGHEHGLRSGTLNVPGIVGFGKACEIASQRLSLDRVHLESLGTKMHRGLKKAFPEILLNGSSEYRLPGNLNFSIPGVKSDQLIGALSTTLAISSSSACQSNDAQASHVLRALGFDKDRLQQAFRLGIGRYTSEDEIEFAIEAIRKHGHICLNH